MTEKVFLPHPSSPARRGSTSPSAPSPQERAPTGKPAVLYSQTSFNFVDFRLRSAEHSSELDALLSLAREFAPCGVARELPTQQSCDCLCAEGAAAREGCDCLKQQSCECLTHDMRVFDALCASVCAPRARLRDVYDD